MTHSVHTEKEKYHKHKLQITEKNITRNLRAVMRRQPRASAACGHCRPRPTATEDASDAADAADDAAAARQEVVVVGAWVGGGPGAPSAHHQLPHPRQDVRRLATGTRGTRPPSHDRQLTRSKLGISRRSLTFLLRVLTTYDYSANS